MKIKPCIPTLILVFFSLNCADRKSDKLNPETSVLLINGDVVQFGEFLLIAKQKRNNILTLFKNQIYDENTFKVEEFWNSNFNGVTPFEKLKQETEKQIIRVKTEQELAEKHKIINKFSYSEFTITLKQENKRRLDALKNKKPIYGPVQYPEKFYYGYLYNNMVIQLKDILGKEVFTFTEIEYKDFYERHKDLLFRNSAKKGSLMTEIIILPGYKTLDEVKKQIRQGLIDEEYEKLIVAKTLSAEVKEVDEILSQYFNYLTLSSHY